MTEDHVLMQNDNTLADEANAQCSDGARRTKILIIDDDTSTRFLLSQILSCSGYEPIEAKDGEAGLRMAIEEHPDLVLVDGLLPRMHGFLVCKAIKESPNPPKVIVLTAVYKKITYRWQVKTEYGADELLVKPVRAAELVACIEKVLSPEAEPDTRAMAVGSLTQASGAAGNIEDIGIQAIALGSSEHAAVEAAGLNLKA